MSKHAARITASNGSGFYALIVRIDYDGQESVIHGYPGRHFVSRKNAERSIAAHMKKRGLDS